MDKRKIYMLPDFLSKYGDSYNELLLAFMPQETLDKATKMGRSWRHVALKRFYIMMPEGEVPDPQNSQIQKVDNPIGQWVLEITEKQ